MNIFKITLFFFILTNKVLSQISVNFENVSYYDDNIYKINTKQSSLINMTSLGSSYSYTNEKSAINFGYKSVFSNYFALPERNNNNHTFILNYTHSSDEATRILDIGAGYALKSGKDNFNIYNEDNFGFWCNYRFPTFEDISNSAGYIFSSIKYPYLPDLSYSEHVLNYNLNFPFETKTTYVMEINMGLKNYTNDYYITTVETITTVIDNPSGSTNGKGKGNGANGNGTGSYTVTENVYSRTKSDKYLSSQILFTNRIAQSITDFSGIQLTHSFRYNFKKDTRNISYSSNLVSDEAIFDDHYSYGGHEINMGLTQILPYSILLKIDAEYFNKKYYNQFKISNEENSSFEDRDDSKYIFSIELQKKIKLFEGFLEPLTVNLKYSYQKNNSTIPLFQFTDNSLLMNITLNLKI